jgi:hypothetical protein
MNALTIIPLNLDTLIHAMEARPATKARAKAWEYLAEVSTVTFDGDALIVPSATWSNTSYRATTTSCTLPSPQALPSYGSRPDRG